MLNCDEFLLVSTLKLKQDQLRNLKIWAVVLHVVWTVIIHVADFNKRGECAMVKMNDMLQIAAGSCRTCVVPSLSSFM